MPPLRSYFDICGAVLAHEAAGQSYLEFVKKALGLGLWESTIAHKFMRRQDAMQFYADAETCGLMMQDQIDLYGSH